MGRNVHYDTAAAVAIEVLDELFRAPSRTLLNLNVPNLEHSSTQGRPPGPHLDRRLIKAAGPRAGGEALSEEGELPLRLGAASPALGDVSDEEPDDDGALVESGYASLTALHGPHEVDDVGLMTLMEKALEADVATTQYLSQSSPRTRRASFRRPRAFFSSTRRIFDLLVGLVARRGVRGARAIASFSASWLSAASRF